MGVNLRWRPTELLLGDALTEEKAEAAEDVSEHVRTNIEMISHPHCYGLERNAQPERRVATSELKSEQLVDGAAFLLNNSVTWHQLYHPVLAVLAGIGTLNGRALAEQRKGSFKCDFLPANGNFNGSNRDSELANDQDSSQEKILMSSDSQLKLYRKIESSHVSYFG